MSAPIVLQIVKPPPKVVLNVIAPTPTTPTPSTPQKKTGLHRTDNTDCFYTRPEVAQSCIDRLLRQIDITTYDVVIIPSAGSGAFSDYFHERQMNVHAYDIEPGKPYIIKADFLTVDLKPFEGRRVLVVDNVPFGRQSSLAKQFIARCSLVSQTIAFHPPEEFSETKSTEDVPFAIPSHR